MNSHLVVENAEGVMTGGGIAQKTVRRTLVLAKWDVQPQTTRTPTYDYLKRRKVATRRRNHLKKRAVAVKNELDLIKRQEKRSKALEKRLEYLMRENDKLILKIINLMGLPNQNPEFIKYVKAKLPLLSGGLK